MGERNQERKEQYKRVRTDFEDLEIEDKALFLLEATVSTVGRGIERIGRGFAEEFDRACRRAADWPADETSTETTNGTATSPTGSQATGPASGSGAGGSDPGDTPSGSEDAPASPDPDSPAGGL